MQETGEAHRRRQVDRAEETGMKNYLYRRITETIYRIQTLGKEAFFARKSSSFRSWDYLCGAALSVPPEKGSV